MDGMGGIEFALISGEGGVFGGESIRGLQAIRKSTAWNPDFDFPEEKILW